MVFTELQDIGSQNLSESFKTINGIGFCYFDPEDELLKEFNPTASLPIYPGEESKRQFYIVSDTMSIIYNTITVTARVQDVSYTIKTSLNYNEDFDNVPSNNSITIFASQYVNGIIPVTLYIKNGKDTIEDVVMDIELDIV